MGTEVKTRAFKRDGAGHPIPGGTLISEIRCIPIVAGSWKGISVTKPCKGFLARTRAAVDFHIALNANPTNYYTLTGELAADMAKEAGETLFYARSSAGNQTLELLCFD